MTTWPDDLPRYPLLDGPSPFGALPRLSAALGGRAELWVKREDLLPVGLGGNKLRNLEFLIGAALADGADTLVTSGRRWSNHARLTAAAGARAGLAVHLVLSGPPAAPPNPGVRLDELFGAVVHQAATDDRAEREARLAAVVAELRAVGRRPFVIGLGGSGALGATGQVLAGWELLGQAAAAGRRVDRIVVPSATGGTQAGLIVAMAGAAARVSGVIVARPEAELRPALATMVDELATSARVRVGSDAIELDPTQLGPGYGRPTAEAAEATALLARTEGLLVDPIYTAKALAALIAGVRSGAWDGETVVFWHAGGLPGLFEPLE
ncbi:MAG TPA: pyridoxal-phosphate dependent enzyme [Candidatus Saccharimonadales bacterium]|nr:pyridoxal-phosphate dependent enzyme [Candidatus Saccharimonadales bacterium]